ncbi:cell envelope integrity protein CreD [Tenacibaculum geojense]|uniref:Cell envelope integrity protein CreD n=1 Tax=Tenacibaculum geojense TaxID=915352 RepID=A0ABW3JT13_9FLAO
MNTNKNGKFGKWIKTSISARMAIVGFLVIMLLIPLSYIKDLVNERMYRQKTVVNEINQKWGKEVLVYGPILKIPYKTYKETTIYLPETKTHQKETEEIINEAYFFPEVLDINATINPESKSRGIYNTAVYKTNINFKGTFTTPDFSDVEIAPKDILWQKAKLIIQTSNVKGVNSKIAIQIHKNSYNFSGNNQNNSQKEHRNNLFTLESKTIAKNDLPHLNPIDFSLTMNVNGSEQIRFVPIGKETTANIKSNWKTANFLGEYIPYNPDKINDNGFDAKWKVLDINRPFAQQSFNHLPKLTKYAFGVNFKIPVDEFQKNERATKYGFLVIALTFLIFFLIQTMSKINIHPFQYLMVGIALIMFYTLLISITEHSSFLKAYLIAGVAVVALITLYSKSILKNTKFPLFIGGSLIILYSFIFVIIQLENYALLVGSIGLFIILAAVMYASRKIDWNNG